MGIPSTHSTALWLHYTQLNKGGAGELCKLNCIGAVKCS